jgi:hypothetical protein
VGGTGPGLATELPALLIASSVRLGMNGVGYEQAFEAMRSGEFGNVILDCGKFADRPPVSGKGHHSSMVYLYHASEAF